MKGEAAERRRPVRVEVAPRAVFTLVLVAACLWLLVRLWPVLLALVAALVVAGTLSPAVRWLEGKRVARGMGIAIVFTAFFVLAVLVGVLTVPTLLVQAAGLLEREPAMRAQLADHLAGTNLTAPLAGWLRGLAPDALMSAFGAKAFAFSLRAFETLAYGLSALFLALYMLIDRDRLRGGLFAVIPRTHHIRLSRIVMNLETIVGSYIRGQLLTSLLMAVFAFLLLSACGVENALALAVFAGLADVLPYIGPILSVGPAVLAALPRGPGVAVVVLVLMVAYEEFESRVLVPRIYGRALRLPSSVVLFALLAGGTLMGILGALLALPVAATLMMLVEELRVELPGEQEGPAATSLRQADDRAEEEYERRTQGIGAEQAAGIAAEISADRRKEGVLPAEPQAEPSGTTGTTESTI
ncbi:MAG: AI-2E family transporter [Deltaproteobacteria bacterium]|nr:AI-2E family transporter [Deltaproteobacteria bacterium]